MREAQETFHLDGEPVFSPRLFLQQLLYTEDLEDKEAALAALRERVSFEELAEGLRAAVYEALPSILEEQSGA